MIDGRQSLVWSMICDLWLIAHIAIHCPIMNEHPTKDKTSKDVENTSFGVCYLIIFVNIAGTPVLTLF